MLRQSGYALGFAVTASLFTAVQNWFDLEWAYSSVNPLSEQSANSITEIYHQGSQWSPEMLVFILHIGVLLCSSILIITLVNSIPRLKLTTARQLSVGIVAVVISLLSMGSYSLRAPGIVNNLDADSIVSNTEPVAAFGMTSRSYDLIQPVNAQTKNDDSLDSQAYLSRCGFCHGANLEGIDGLGVTLVDSAFLQNMDLEETVEFLKIGRMINSDDSISGGVMPGFSWLPEAELQDIAEYIKSSNISE